MSKRILLAPLLLMGACAHHAQTLTTGERAQTPSERLGPEATTGTEPKIIATLDEAIGPQFTEDGKRFTATVAPGSTLPAGTKIGGRVIDVQAAAAGTMGYAILAVNSIQTSEGGYEFFDGRVAGVELLEAQPGGREVNPSGAPSSEVIGSVVPADKIPPTGAMDLDPLSRGTIISLGSGSQPQQLDKGTRIVIAAGNGDRKAVAGEADITNLRDLGNGSADGRFVKLEGVPVESVIGDVVFWVGPSKSDRTLVVLDQILDEPETRTVITPGMTVNISGTAEKTPSASDAPHLWKMVDAKEASELKGHPVYIHATRVTKR